MRLEDPGGIVSPVATKKKKETKGIVAVLNLTRQPTTHVSGAGLPSPTMDNHAADASGGSRGDRLAGRALRGVGGARVPTDGALEEIHSLGLSAFYYFYIHCHYYYYYINKHY